VQRWAYNGTPVQQTGAALSLMSSTSSGATREPPPAGDVKDWTLTPLASEIGTVTVSAHVAGVPLTASARVEVVCDFFREPTDDPILNDPKVQREFQRLWAESNPNDPGPGRVEKGAFITQFGGEYHFFSYQGPSTRCTSESGNVLIPAGHTVVGFVHTHPDNGGTLLPADGSCHGNTDPNAEFKEGPSPTFDVRSARALRRLFGRKISGYVIDPDDVHRYGSDLPSKKFRRNLTCNIEAR